MIMNTRETNLPWDDWEDQGGFDDEEALFGKYSSSQKEPFLERPWYYEKKRYSVHQPLFVCIQMSFLIDIPIIT